MHDERLIAVCRRVVNFVWNSLGNLAISTNLLMRVTCNRVLHWTISTQLLSCLRAFFALWHQLNVRVLLSVCDIIYTHWLLQSLTPRLGSQSPLITRIYLQRIVLQEIPVHENLRHFPEANPETTSCLLHLNVTDFYSLSTKTLLRKTVN